jgi:ankyrin repeat protein
VAARPGPLFWLGILGGTGCLGIVALVALFMGIDAFATRGEEALVREQLDDLRRGELARAYRRLPGAYRSMNTLDDFKAFVAAHPALADNKDASFPNRRWSIDVSGVTFEGAILTSRTGVSEVFNFHVDTDSEGKRFIGIERGLDPKALLKEGGDVNAPVKDATETLHAPIRVAIDARRPDVALLLVKRGADVNAEHALYRAARATYSNADMEDVALALVEKGADVRDRVPDADPGVPTVLHAAIVSGAPRLVRALIAKGAEVNAVDASTGLSVLHFAVALLGEKEEPEIVKALLEAGADVRARDARGNTPLNLVPAPRRRTIALLLDKGADVDARDADGHTPLYAALRGCEAETATLLISRGASKRLPRRDVEDLARVEDHCRTGSPTEMKRIQGAVTAVVRTLEAAPD